ncbi:phosphate ABC transporter permease subunit PstC [Kiloniella laminariae]|uniref:Phosphate transport system permease protein n=1 Tax=Kiloniella laminariae TaxID=454162 RepID=A0ABT4LLM8_9PROT|nr:phosphate ABC transporter permease subunit PstC [Kiloniella laminariae]MCZ4281266.1 phosphate ABC transporter permease subunit PstC [Kiloniella laminariae]
MEQLALFFALIFLIILGYILGKGRAVALSGHAYHPLHSRLPYYGLYTAIWCGLPSLLLMAGWMAFEPAIAEAIVSSKLSASNQNLTSDQITLYVNDVINLASGGIISREVNNDLQAATDSYIFFRQISYFAMAVVAISLSLGGLFSSLKSISPDLRARNKVEKIISVVMMACSTIAILTTVGIVFSLIFETLRFFNKVPLTEFLFGLHWSPQTALRTDQVGGSGSFGAVPLFAGTMLITFISMVVAVPVGLMSAIYMSEYAGKKFRAFAKPLLEILAGIPTVVYGFFAALTVAPFFRNSGEFFGLDVSSESALAAGMVMGIMIIPFISSLSDDVMNSVPQSLRDASYAMGATKSETITKVILPAALPGIVGAVLLAMSRAIGETMIVVMAAGLAANLTANPLEAVTTVTVQIVTLLVGDQEFDSAKTLAAFALGLLLFIVTLAMNIVALKVVRKYREKYD